MEIMTSEQKELLLKDLCARLPYGVKVEAHGLLKTISDDNRGPINAHVLNGLNLGDYFKTYSIDCIEKVPLFDRKGVCNIKPYLFPLSSMTEEQWADTPYANLNKFTFDSFKCGCSTLAFETYEVNLNYVVEFINWCYKNHFDIGGLISKGLAIDCTCLNIY
jgi:hypothetical protein